MGKDPLHEILPILVQCNRAGTCGANANAHARAGTIAHRSRLSRERPRPSTREFLVPCEPVTAVRRPLGLGQDFSKFETKFACV